MNKATCQMNPIEESKGLKIHLRVVTLALFGFDTRERICAKHEARRHMDQYAILVAMRGHLPRGSSLP